MISARIVGDSVNLGGCRLTSFILKYPRFIHSEFMTHRCFSRNAASSRAIPFGRMKEDVVVNPAMPERWPTEQRGMSGGDEMHESIPAMMDAWMDAREECIDAAGRLHRMGLHKSLCNRIVEPWSHITVLATATDAGLSNFFALRAHPAVMPEFQVLAFRMLHTYQASEPRRIMQGDWHIPRFSMAADDYTSTCPTETKLKIATARCARLSYLTFDGEIDPEKDIQLHDQLASDGHWSPFEHCARAENPQYIKSNFDTDIQWSGWSQYRKRFAGENCVKADLSAIMAAKPDWITL